MITKYGSSIRFDSSVIMFFSLRCNQSYLYQKLMITPPLWNYEEIRWTIISNYVLSFTPDIKGFNTYDV